MSDATIHPHATDATGIPPNDPLRQRMAAAVKAVRDTRPLAQSFTNFVTINLVANAQLASGGSAAMSFLPDDILDLASSCGASYINVGTLQPFYPDALDHIARSFHEMGHHWVLDPVAAGIGSTRTRILHSFRENPPTVIRANASEILALHDMWGLRHDTDADDANNGTDTRKPSTKPAGVESIDAVDTARTAASDLAHFLSSASPDHHAAVSISGEIDLVTDGDHTYRLPGGSPMMTKITGAGCSLGGVMATYLAVSDPLTAAVTASALFDRAGEIAQANSHGPGSFQVGLLDALWNLTPDQVAGSPILEA